MSHLPINDVAQQRCTVRLGIVSVGLVMLPLYIFDPGGGFSGMACRPVFAVCAFPFVVYPSVPCSLPWLSWFGMVSFARSLIDLAPRSPCSYSGCFAHSSNLMTVGYDCRRGDVVRGPSQLMSSFADHGYVGVAGDHTVHCSHH